MRTTLDRSLSGGVIDSGEFTWMDKAHSGGLQSRSWIRSLSYRPIWTPTVTWDTQ